MIVVISRKFGSCCVEEVTTINIAGIVNDKLREEKYKECIQSCDCRELIRIIKTVYLRDKKRMEQGKKKRNDILQYFSKNQVPI